MTTLIAVVFAIVFLFIELAVLAAAGPAIAALGLLVVLIAWLGAVLAWMAATAPENERS